MITSSDYKDVLRGTPKEGMGDNKGDEEAGTRVGGGKCVKIRSDLLALEMKEDEHLRKSKLP